MNPPPRPESHHSPSVGRWRGEGEGLQGEQRRGGSEEGGVQGGESTACVHKIGPVLQPEDLLPGVVLLPGHYSVGAATVVASASEDCGVLGEAVVGEALGDLGVDFED